MDENKKLIITKKIERTLENLKKNNMQAYYIEKKTQVVECNKHIKMVKSI